MDKDQMVVKEFLQGLGSSFEARDPVEYLKNIQRMKGEWFNQQGRTNEQVDHLESRDCLHIRIQCQKVCVSVP